MKRVIITITAEVEDGVSLDAIAAMAATAEVQVIEPDDRDDDVGWTWDNPDRVTTEVTMVDLNAPGTVLARWTI